MNPVCCSCHRRLRLAQKGALIRDEEHVVHTCDVYRCPICGTETATNFALASVFDDRTRRMDLYAERGE
jgi:hypothetical protein